MRTTLSIDSEVLAAAKRIATEHSKSLGNVISELARIGLHAESKRALPASFPVFKVSKRARTIGPEDVQRGHDYD